MKFDDLDSKMRALECHDDSLITTDRWIIIRLDGRGFTRLTKEVLPLEIPFDPGFRDAMWHTTEHMMQAGFRVIYAYVQSDEISILIHKADNTHGRKLRKWLSLSAGEASACFALAMKVHAAFDARICQLENIADIVDYFRWRHEDAHRNCVSAYCYWQLRKQGIKPKAAQEQLSGLSLTEKQRLLEKNDIHYEVIPAWQKRGIGFYWQNQTQTAINQKTGETVEVQRRKIVRDEVLPLADDYSLYLHQLLERENRV